MSRPHKPNFLTNAGIFILIVAVEAFILTFVWNHAVTAAFGATTMLFGHMFMMWAAFRVFFRDIFKLGEIHYVLKEIREIQYYTATSSTRKPIEQSKKPDSMDVTDK